MTEIIDKIILFRALKLKPILKEESMLWETEMDKHIISTFDMNDCFVRIKKIEDIIIPIEKNIVPIEKSIVPIEKSVIPIEKVVESVILRQKSRKKSAIPKSSRVLRSKIQPTYRAMRIRKEKKCCFVCMYVTGQLLFI